MKKVQVEILLFQKGDCVLTPNGLAIVEKDEVFKDHNRVVLVTYTDKQYALMKYGVTTMEVSSANCIVQP